MSGLRLYFFIILIFLSGALSLRVIGSDAPKLSELLKYIGLTSKTSFEKLKQLNLEEVEKIKITFFKDSPLSSEQFAAFFRKVASKTRTIAFYGVPVNLDLDDLELLDKVELCIFEDVTDEQLTSEKMKSLLEAMPSVNSVTIFRPVTTPINFTRTKLKRICFAGSSSFANDPQAFIKQLQKCPESVIELDFECIDPEKYDVLKKASFLVKRPYYVPYLEKITFHNILYCPPYAGRLLMIRYAQDGTALNLNSLTLKKNVTSDLLEGLPLGNCLRLTITSASPFKKDDYERLFKQLDGVSILSFKGIPDNFPFACLSLLKNIKKIKIEDVFKENEVKQILDRFSDIEVLSLPIVLLKPDQLVFLKALKKLFLRESSHSNPYECIDFIKKCPQTLKEIHFENASNELTLSLSQDSYLARRPFLQPSLSLIDCSNQEGSFPFYYKLFNLSGEVCEEIEPSRLTLLKELSAITNAVSKTLVPPGWSVFKTLLFQFGVYFPVEKLISSLVKTNSVLGAMHTMGWFTDWWGCHTANLPWSTYFLFSILRGIFGTMVNISDLCYSNLFSTESSPYRFMWFSYLGFIRCVHPYVIATLASTLAWFFKAADDGFSEDFFIPISRLIDLLSLFPLMPPPQTPAEEMLEFAQSVLKDDRLGLPSSDQKQLLSKEIVEKASKKLKEERKEQEKLLFQSLRGIKKSGLAELSAPTVALPAIQEPLCWKSDTLIIAKNTADPTVLRYKFDRVKEVTICEDQPFSREQLKEFFAKLPPLRKLSLFKANLQPSDLLSMQGRVDKLYYSCGKKAGAPEAFCLSVVPKKLTLSCAGGGDLPDLSKTSLVEITLRLTDGAGSRTAYRKFINNCCPKTLEVLSILSEDKEEVDKFVRSDEVLAKRPKHLPVLSAIRYSYGYERFVKKFNEKGISKGVYLQHRSDCLYLDKASIFQELEHRDFSSTKEIKLGDCDFSGGQFFKLFTSSSFAKNSTLKIKELPGELRPYYLGLLQDVTSLVIKPDRPVGFLREEIEGVLEQFPQLSTLSIKQPLMAPLTFSLPQLKNLYLNCSKNSLEGIVNQLKNLPKTLESLTLDKLDNIVFDELEKIITSSKVYQFRKIELKNQTRTAVLFFDKEGNRTPLHLMLDEHSSKEQLEKMDLSLVAKLTFTAAAALEAEEYEKLLKKCSANVTALCLKGLPPQFNHKQLALLSKVREVKIEFDEIAAIIPYLPTVETLIFTKLPHSTVSLKGCKNLTMLLLKNCAHLPVNGCLKLIKNCPQSTIMIRFYDPSSELVDVLQQSTEFKKRPTHLPQLETISCLLSGSKIYYVRLYKENGELDEEMGSIQLLKDRIINCTKKEGIVSVAKGLLSSAKNGCSAVANTFINMRASNWSMESCIFFALLYYPTWFVSSALLSYIPLVKYLPTLGIATPHDVWGPHLENLPWQAYWAFILGRAMLTKVCTTIGLSDSMGTTLLTMLPPLFFSHYYKDWLIQSCKSEIEPLVTKVQETAAPLISLINNIKQSKLCKNRVSSFVFDKGCKTYEFAKKYCLGMYRDFFVAPADGGKDNNCGVKALSKDGLWWHTFFASVGSSYNNIKNTSLKKLLKGMRTRLHPNKLLESASHEVQIIDDASQFIKPASWSWKMYAFTSFFYKSLNKLLIKQAKKVPGLNCIVRTPALAPLDLIGPLSTNFSWLEHVIFVLARNALIPKMSQQLENCLSIVKLPILDDIARIAVLPSSFLLSSWLVYRFMRASSGFAEGASAFFADKFPFSALTLAGRRIITKLPKTASLASFFYNKLSARKFQPKPITTFYNPAFTILSAGWAVSKSVFSSAKDMATNPLFIAFCAIAGGSIALHLLINQNLFTPPIKNNSSPMGNLQKNYLSAITSLVKTVTSSAVKQTKTLNERLL